MTGRDMLVQQFGAIYSVIARNIDGVTHADSLAPAAGGGNTANWILGHLVNVQNQVMRIIGAPPVWASMPAPGSLPRYRIRPGSPCQPPLLTVLMAGITAVAAVLATVWPRTSLNWYSISSGERWLLVACTTLT